VITLEKSPEQVERELALELDALTSKVAELASVELSSGHLSKAHRLIRALDALRLARTDINYS
jgi:hypothetical protein